MKKNMQILGRMQITMKYPFQVDYICRCIQLIDLFAVDTFDYLDIILHLCRLLNTCLRVVDTNITGIQG